MLTKVTNIWSIHLKITNIHSDLDLQLGLWLVLVLTLGLVLVYGRGFFTLSRGWRAANNSNSEKKNI